MRNQKDEAVVVAAHDGLISMLTGVGMVAHTFIDNFQEIVSKTDYFDLKSYDLLTLAPFLDNRSSDYNPELCEQTERNSMLYRIPTFGDGSSESAIWGEDILQFESACLSAASFIVSISTQYKHITLIAHDLIFVNIRKYIPYINNVSILWIPHSLGCVFEDKYSNAERIHFEKSSIKHLIDNSSDGIGYIGDYFRDVLLEEYKVPRESLYAFKNGLNHKQHEYTASFMGVESISTRYGIPLDKKILFSWGRCVEQKGFDLILEAYKKLLETNTKYHLVLLMPTETSVGSYKRSLQSSIAQIPRESISVFFDFDSQLPSQLLQHPNLEKIIFASRFEGTPITPMEALFLRDKGVPIIYSSIAPFKDILETSPNTYEFTSNNSESLFSALNNTQINHMVGSHSYEISDFVTNYSTGLNTFYTHTQ